MATQTEWRKVEEVEAPVLEDEGDVFAPLKRIRDAYYARAQRMLTKATDDETGQLCDPLWKSVIEEVRACGDRINALIPQEEVHAEPVTSSEPELSTGAVQGEGGGFADPAPELR